METDIDKLVAAILTTMCRRENSIPTVEQVVLTYDRMLKALAEKSTTPED
jgi:hypothetical protein